MNKASFIVAVVLLCIAPPLFARDAGGVIVSHSETLQDLTIERRKPQAPAKLVFDALGQRFEVLLEPNDRLIGGVRGRAAELGIYRGRLAGKPDSWARIVISNDVPTGLVWDGQEMLAIEALEGSSTPLIYRLKDTYVEPGTMSCGTGSSETSLAAAYATVTDELQAAVVQAAGAVDELKIGIISDFEFTRLAGADVEGQILARMNFVDGIFSEQLGVQITVEVIETFTTSDDPFTSALPEDLLLEVRNYRASNPAQNSQGLTHLITGRDLDGTTVGIAYRDALCRTEFGAGLSEGRRDTVTDSLIIAHEIGHNFGAEHDGEVGSVCETVTGNFLMSPRVSSTDQFSSCSIDTIRPRIAAAACINPLPATDIAIALSGTAPNLFLGAATDLVFDITNSGTQDALNLEATFDIPPNLALDSIATTAGTCTSGAGQASCTVGTLVASSSASVALSVTAASVGSDTLVASVTADGDASSQSVPIVVDTATDLRIANTAPLSVTLDSILTLSPRIDNLSTLAATDLALSISFSAGLRVEGASWPGGTCTVGANAVDCQLADLAAGSSVSAAIQLTAITTGSQTYTASIVSLEADANDADNSVTATVNVTSTTSGGSGGSNDSGGGGALGWLWLLLSALVGFVARRTQA